MNKTIRVLHTEWSGGWGGQEIRILNEMLSARALGVEVFLACRSDSILKQHVEQHHIPVFVLPFKGNADLKTLFALKKIVKQNQIDIVNTHSGKDTWVGGFAAKLAGVKFIRTRHLSNRIKTTRINFINELADYIVTTGSSVRDDMIKYNRIRPEKIQSIPTGIDVELFNPDNYDENKCRSLLNLAEDEMAIGIVAVLRRFKRHDLFLQMAQRLIAKYPEQKLKFFIIGEGPQRDNIENIIANLNLSGNVHLSGHVDDVPTVLMALDIFVLSSDSCEGVPQSVIQALFMNKKVVATDSGSTKDLLVDNNFRLVGAGSVDELVTGVAHHLQSNAENNNQETPRETMIKNYSLTDMALRLLDIYRKIVE